MLSCFFYLWKDSGLTLVNDFNNQSLFQWSNGECTIGIRFKMLNTFGRAEALTPTDMHCCLPWPGPVSAVCVCSGHSTLCSYKLYSSNITLGWNVILTPVIVTKEHGGRDEVRNHHPAPHQQLEGVPCYCGPRSLCPSSMQTLLSVSSR